MEIKEVFIKIPLFEKFNTKYIDKEWKKIYHYYRQGEYSMSNEQIIFIPYSQTR